MVDTLRIGYVVKSWLAKIDLAMSGKLLRINQLDAQVLDSAILEVLQQNVEQIFDLFQVIWVVRART